MKVQETCVDLDALGRFIRERRRALRLTQQQLAERVGWQQERISILENGKYGLPSLRLLAQMADALEVSREAPLAAMGFVAAPVEAEQTGRSQAEVTSEKTPISALHARIQSVDAQMLEVWQHWSELDENCRQLRAGQDKVRAQIARFQPHDLEPHR